jgi:hypothetical protein
MTVAQKFSHMLLTQEGQVHDIGLVLEREAEVGSLAFLRSDDLGSFRLTISQVRALPRTSAADIDDSY